MQWPLSQDIACIATPRPAAPGWTNWAIILLGEETKQKLVGLVAEETLSLGVPVRWRGCCGTPGSFLSVLLELNKRSLHVGCV